MAGYPPPPVFFQKSAQSSENKWFKQKSKFERVQESAHTIENTAVSCERFGGVSLQVEGNRGVSFAQLSFLALRSAQGKLFGQQVSGRRERGGTDRPIRLVPRLALGARSGLAS